MLLRNELAALEASDLIRRALGSADAEYWFKHGLVQETAYESLLARHRKRLHRLVAESIENAYPQALDEQAPLLARHWDEAGEPARAFDYYLKAGTQAARVYARAEASSAFDRARALSADLELSREQWLGLYLTRGRQLELAGEYQQALANYQELEAIGQRMNDSILEIHALIQASKLYGTPNTLSNLPRAQESALRALQLARQANDRLLQAQALWSLLLVYYFAGEFEQAIQYGEESLQLARELGLREQLAYTLNDLARPYSYLGRFADAAAARDEAERLWRELGNLPMLTDSLVNATLYEFLNGEPRAGLPKGLEAERISREIGNTWGEAFAHEILGNLYFVLGETATALRHLEQSAALGRQVQFLDPLYNGIPFQALVYSQLGAVDRGLMLLEQLCAEHLPVPSWMTTAHAMRALLYATRGELEDAARALAEAERVNDLLLNRDSPALLYIDMAKIELALAQHNAPGALQAVEHGLEFLASTGIRTFRGLLFWLQGRAFEQVGDLDAAFKAWQDADTESRALGLVVTQWEAQAGLARLEKQRGNFQPARRWQRQALDAVAFIADHAPPDLRETFLKRPEVIELQSLFAETSPAAESIQTVPPPRAKSPAPRARQKNSPSSRPRRKTPPSH